MHLAHTNLTESRVYMKSVKYEVGHKKENTFLMLKIENYKNLIFAREGTSKNTNPF